ncbi:MAG: hypothetical protein CMP11_04595 [Zetaproteobacteria bacterium]|nr:hypothetical protein [Pseudobdellovibrionaceae bacterium]
MWTKHYFAYLLTIFFYFEGTCLERLGHIPDEYESSGGHSWGMGNGGSAAVSGLGSIKLNPAMISVEKKYQASAGYHWPSSGREYYQVGVVDSKTSPTAAGISYTSSFHEYTSFSKAPTAEEKEQAFYDSLVKKRISGAISNSVGKFHLGLGVQFIEGFDSNMKPLRGFTTGLGLVGFLTQSLRFGISGENLINHRIEQLAPRTYRAGMALLLFNGLVTLHADYRQRQRVNQEYEAGQIKLSDTGDKTFVTETVDLSEKDEKMFIGSFSVLFQDLLRLFGGYGHAIDETERQSLSGGIAVVNSNFSISYVVGRPYLAEDRYHHGMNVSMNVTL